jgi:hypothetical protein
VIACWLWDAGSACGVTDDGSRARKAAAQRIRADGTGTARVEKAFLVPGTSTLIMIHDRTGEGWSAVLYRNGRISWKALPVSRELAAS